MRLAQRHHNLERELAETRKGGASGFRAHPRIALRRREPIDPYRRHVQERREAPRQIQIAKPGKIEAIRLVMFDQKDSDAGGAGVPLDAEADPGDRINGAFIDMRIGADARGVDADDFRA